MLSRNKESFTSSFPICLPSLYFPCLIVLTVIECWSGGSKHCYLLLDIFFKDFIYLFLEREEGREKERERNIDYLSHTPPTRDLDATQVCALTPVTFRFTGWHTTHWPHQSGLVLNIKGKTFNLSPLNVILVVAFLYTAIFIFYCCIANYPKT